MAKSRLKKGRVVIAATILILICAAGALAYLFNIIPQKEYSAEDFDIEQIKSSVDFNDNGVDDYTDIMLGARKDAENHPEYNGKYWDITIAK